MDRTCWMCGFDSTVVKLTTMQAFDDKGKMKEMTVCVDCKPLALAQNHPINHNLSEQTPDQGGFIKPSTPEGNYPPVRPQ